ncbi:hypothetical protein [Kutzneria sp. NPDC051319]|uniref:hypothetical protein n=1 Tax=Kutzneria sp. NPDC051319 TaxID=3155047 RepID=UPI00343BC90B
MRLPHRLTVVTPAEVVDQYDNPTPALDYGPAAARRELDGLLQPRGDPRGTDTPEQGRQSREGLWWLFTAQPVTARERVEYGGAVYAVQGFPHRWEPRPGHVHYETTLTHVEG